MIWIIMGLLLGGTFLYLCMPLLSKNSDGESNSPQATMLIAGLAIVLSFGAFGLYSMLGRPDLTGPNTKPVLSAQQAVTQNADAKHENDMSLEQLVDRLKQRLDKDPESADGWMLYARSLMNLGRFDEALTAYEKVLTLSDNNPSVLDEFDKAKAFATQRQSGIPAAPPARGPNAEDVQAASEMTPEDRNAMIMGMVNNLATRLRDNPDDPQGWARLLRARQVLGQTAEAEADIALMRETYQSDPRIADDIIKQAGWGDN